MALTKQQLLALNNSSFPNNNAGFITPELLRTYNSSSIGAFVDEIDYTIDSASFNSRIINSTVNTGSLVTTASFNAYTASQDFKNTTFATTGSNTFIGNQIITGSLGVSSSITANVGIILPNSTFGQTIVDQRTRGIRIYNTENFSETYLQLGQNSPAGGVVLSQQSGRLLVNVSASFTGDVSASGGISSSTINGLGNATLFSASVNSRILAITGSGGNVDTSSLVTTASFNEYTASQDFKNTTFATTSSVNSLSASIFSTDATQSNNIASNSSSIGLLQTFSASSDSRYVQNSQTSSMAVSSSTYAVTASYALNAQTASEARNVVIVARNGNQSTLGAGTVVRITGATGDNPIFNSSSYTTEALSSNTLGILRTSIASGADGEVVVNGIVYGVNTDPANGYVAGDVIYLSASGQFTRTQPQAPEQTVTLGEVLRAQQNNGSIYVNISNGWELNELHNVQINTPLTNDLLAYESSSYGLWKNKSFSSLGLATTSSVNSISTSVGLLQTFSGSQYKADSASFDTRINAAGGQPQVQDEGTILGNVSSFNFIGAGVTASVSSGTASVTITGGGSIDTSSLATTGSNTFVGNQIISGNVELSENSNLTVNNGGITKLENTWVKALITTSSVTINAGGLISTGSIVTTNDVTALGSISASGNVIGANILTFATTGSNTFTGQQTISGSNLNFSVTGSISTNGVQFPNSKIYQNNFLNFEANNIGVDMVVAGTTSGTNLNFRNTSTSGQIQFTADSGAVSIISNNSTVSLSGSAVNLNGVDFIPFSSSVNSRLLVSTINTSSFATTGSNTFIGNQTITGSVTISGSATSDLTVVGQVFISSSATGATTQPRITVSGSAGTTTINRNSITTRNATNQAALNPLAIYATNLTTSDEIGFSVDPSGFPNWSFGPGIYVNDATDSYPVVFGFQDKANYTDGTVTVLPPLALFPQGAPTSPESGSLYFSSADSHFYGWNGIAWKQLDN